MKQDRSFNKLTAALIEACIDRDMQEAAKDESEILSSDIWEEHQKFREEVMNSPRLQAEMVVMAAALRSDDFTSTNPPSTEAAARMYNQGTITDWHLELVLNAFREWFFYGWHSRGALEEAGTLARLVDGRNRRRS